MHPVPLARPVRIQLGSPHRGCGICIHSVCKTLLIARHSGAPHKWCINGYTIGNVAADSIAVSALLIYFFHGDISASFAAHPGLGRTTRDSNTISEVYLTQQWLHRFAQLFLAISDSDFRLQ